MAMQETYSVERDNLFAATQVMPVVADKLTIAISQTLKRGSLVTSAGALAGAADVYAVLAHDIDTTEGAKEAAVYLTGEFNANALNASVEVASCKEAARKVGIFIKPAISN